MTCQRRFLPKRMRAVCTMVAACLSLLMVCGTAAAEEASTHLNESLTATAGANKWEWTIAPYFWAPSVSSDVGAGPGLKLHVKAGFSRIWDVIDFAGMGVVEARNGRVVLFSDLDYVKFSDKVAVQPGLSANAGAKVWQWTPAVGYSVYWSDASNIDLMAGARLWSVSTSADAFLGAQELLGFHGSKTWVDAIAGAKAQHAFTPEFFVSGWVLAGAGGSDYTWDLMAAAGYKFNPRFSVMAGYRAEKVKYSNGGFVANPSFHGPILGGLFKF